jgi:hypothetical protein
VCFDFDDRVGDGQREQPISGVLGPAKLSTWKGQVKA